MKQTGSSFVSPWAMAVLALLILVCAYFGFAALEAFLIGLLLLCAGAFFWAKFSLERIEVVIDSEDCRAFPGQGLETDVLLKNNKVLPLLRLDVRFPVEKNGCAAAAEAVDGDEENYIYSAFLWVMPKQSIKWTQKAAAVSRGVCSISSLQLLSGDGFGLTVKEREVPLAKSFRYVVYPALLPVNVAPVLSRLREPESAKNGFYTDRTLLLGTREYRDGDSFRDINWRMLAKSDEMQINIHEKLAMKRLCFICDLQSFTYKGMVEAGTQKELATLLHREEFERMLSLCASMIYALNEREVICSLVIPGYGEKEARIEIPETRDVQVLQQLTALAEIDYRTENCSFPFSELTQLHHRLGQMYVLSMGAEASFEKQQSESLHELGAIRIVCGSCEELMDGHSIIKETELMLI